MILITGGAFQGKRSFAESLVTGRRGALVSDGFQDPYETAFKRPIIAGFHNFVRRLLREDGSVEQFLSDIRKRNPGVIVTSDELGCGIVPADPFEREWREAAGRAAVRLASDSEAVYRLVCGIAIQIKSNGTPQATGHPT